MPMDDVKTKTTSCRVGVDVGGTFTDLVLADSRTGDLAFFKEPSVPDDPATSVERGLQGIIARAGVEPAAV
jgi:N-methylhydantoinase A